MFRIVSDQPARSPALITEDGRIYTYGALAKAARRLGGRIGGRGLVFCLCSNTPGSVLGYLACSEAGAVPFLLNGMLEEGMLRNLTDLYRPGRLWLPVGRRGLFPDAAVLAEEEDYVLLDTGCQPCPLHPELALLLTTSGSTGSPKLVRQSRKNILSNAAAIAEYLELNESERPITTLPMHYTYGLSILHSHFLAGAAVLLTEKSVVQQEFWDFFRAGGATSLSGVPATYDLLKRAGLFERDLPSFRYFTQAGGRLSVEMHRRCAQFAQETGRRFYAMYGQTEATARMSYLPWRLALEKCGSIGVPIPGGSFTLVDAQGGEITQPEVSGELVYRGENVTLGYAQTPEDLTRGDDRNGILHTGDLARRDADGCYYITGRMKRFLKLAGSRVNLDECEQMVKAAYPDCDCACCGTDDHLRVFVTNGADGEKLRSLLCGKLGVRLTSLTVHEIPQIPRNSAGKILYPKLEELP
ncbi:MAG: AMP-binding protein [Intestinimonas sp.]|jgi:acyl-coenzyme A synthetase/AMP-(fatty) acid ligase|nr:AMP-binding protein [Intestinimonas sp.]